MNPQANKLNETIKINNQTVYGLLSKKGIDIFFPKKGILSQSAEARGTKINATIGAAIEDDGTPMRLKSLESMININPSLVFPYAPSFGRPDLRKKWKTMLYEKNPSLKGKKISLPVVTNALTHGLSIIGYLFFNENDKIFLSELYWGNYNLIFTLRYGTKLDTFDLFNDNKMDLQSFKNKLNNSRNGKKILLLNFPNNPTGYTPTIQEVKTIISFIKKSAEQGSKILVIVDDAYFGLIYEEGIEKESIFSYLADIHENVLAVKIDGPTKEDYVWGFRVGFITFGIKNGTEELYSALESKTAGAIRGNISNASNLSQSLILQAFQSPTYKHQKEDKYEILKLRYEAVKRCFEENEKYKEVFSPLPFNSGYFMCIKLRNGLEGEDIRQSLLKFYNTGVISISNILRIAFSSVPEHNIPELFENIYNACKKAEKYSH